MFCVVTGGSGSGKSVFAENIAVNQREESYPLIYIATMAATDDEAKQKINMHRQMRKDKDFTTVECYTNLKNVKVPSHSTVLLDCVSNLAANEMFMPEGHSDAAVEEIIDGVENIAKKCENLIIVTNEIFSDGCNYDDNTLQYIENMGKINIKMAELADNVVEMVYGIPVYHKGGKL